MWFEVEDKGLEKTAFSTGKTAVDRFLLSDCSQSVENPLSWAELRQAIIVCPDLPEACRERLVAEGDAAINDRRCF